MMKILLLFAWACVVVESAPLTSENLGRPERELCTDTNNQCAYWASIGECQKNPGWMTVNCKKSCNTCGGDTSSSKFASGSSVGIVRAVNEASGLGASRRHPGVLYTLNDSGGQARLFAISATDGHQMGVITVNGAVNYDWEDLAVGPCGDRDEHCIFVADTGGNSGRVANTVYKLREPSYIGDQSVNVVDTFKYSWDEPDCESVMVDSTGQVYLISKVHPGHRPSLYALPSWGWGSWSRVAITRAVKIPITSRVINPVAADVSPNGDEILIKAYDHVYYWRVASGESITSALSRKPTELPIAKSEGQGETICWKANGDGYYTLSEGVNQPLFYFKRV